MDISEFYRHPLIRYRLAEYCGGSDSDPASFTTAYLVGVSEKFVREKISPTVYFSVSREQFDWLLEKNVDLFRAVWDRENILGILDIEYFNLNYPGEAYFNPQKIFYQMEDIYQRIVRLFTDLGMNYLSIMTGQGYHFSFRISKKSPVFSQLASLGYLEDTLKAKYNTTQGRRKHIVSTGEGMAFQGMGLLLEYFVGLLFKNLRFGYTGIPVVVGDLATGQHEAFSLDLSMYGDPIYMRDVRCPFSLYQKHKIFTTKFGSDTARQIPVLITLPRTSHRTLDDLLSIRRDFNKAISLAENVSTAIPENSAGLSRLISSYKRSQLFRFHKFYNQTKVDDPGKWPTTYDFFNPQILPPCIAHCLREPNPHILKPTNIQNLVRTLLKLGWHPKHIGGLVRSKLERDYGWGNEWFKYDAATRADFYCRLYSGLLFTGRDQEDDFNCLSQAEKGYCWKPNCGFKLENYKLTQQELKNFPC